MSRIAAVALLLVGFQADPGTAYQERDCRSVPTLSPADAFESLRKLYVAGDTPPHSLLECAGSIRQGIDERLRAHIVRHARIALPLVDSVRNEEERNRPVCEEARPLACELRDLRKQQILGRLLIDLLDIPAAPATTMVDNGWGKAPGGNGPIGKEPGADRCPPETKVDPPVRVATSVAAGPSVVAAGVRADFPAIMSVPLSAGLEYIDYMRRPAGLLLSAGMRRRPLAIMLGLSVGAGRPDPWVSLTADTSFGVHVGLLVGPAVGVRIGS